MIDKPAKARLPFRNLFLLSTTQVKDNKPRANFQLNHHKDIHNPVLQGAADQNTRRLV